MPKLTARCFLRQAFTIHWLILVISCEPFNPSVHCNCVDGRMMIVIRTETSFNGVVYTEGHRSDCNWQAQGAQEMSIALPLGAPDCGVLYNQVAEDYHVILYVRQHRTILLEQDRAFNLTCFSPKSKSAAQTIRWMKSALLGREGSASLALLQRLHPDTFFSGSSTIIGLQILNTHHKKTHETVFGEQHTLQVFSRGSRGSDTFLVKACTAYAGDNSATLTDGDGCSVDLSILSDFRYADTGLTAEATLHSMFRIAGAPYVHFQCNVSVCSDNPCSKVDCDQRRQQPASRDRQAERTASTTVTVLDIGNLTEILYDAACSDQHNILSWMCICFGLVFICAVCVHAAFCYLQGHCQVPPRQPATAKHPAIAAFIETTNALHQIPPRPKYQPEAKDWET